MRVSLVYLFKSAESTRQTDEGTDALRHLNLALMHGVYHNLEVRTATKNEGK